MLTCGKCVASWRKGRAREISGSWRQITFIGRTVFISRSWTVSGCSSSGVVCARCGNSGSTVRDTTNTTFAATAYLTSPRSLPKQILGHAVTHGQTRTPRVPIPRCWHGRRTRRGAPTSETNGCHLLYLYGKPPEELGADQQTIRLYDQHILAANHLKSWESGSFNHPAAA